MHLISLIFGIIIGVIAAWLLGFLLVGKETMRDIESQFETADEDTDTTA